MQRRDFIISLSTSIAAIAAGCRKPVHYIAPMIMPEELEQTGRALYYNTVYPHYGIPYGITVKTREGKPVKIDGNPDSQVNGSGTNATIQASLYSVYNPNRFKKAEYKGKDVELDEVLAVLKERIENVSFLRLHSNGVAQAGISPKEDVIPAKAGISPKHMSSLRKQVSAEQRSSSLQKTSYKNVIFIGSGANSPVYTHLLGEIKKRYSNVEFFCDFPVSLEDDIPWGFFQELSDSKSTRRKIIICLGADILGASRHSLIFQKHIYASNNRENIEILTAEPYLTLTGMSSDIRETLSLQELDVLASMIFEEISSAGSSYKSSFPIIPADYRHLKNSRIIKYLSESKDADVFIFTGDYLSERTKAIGGIINGFNVESQKDKYHRELKRLETAVSSESILFFLNTSGLRADPSILGITDKVPAADRILLSQQEDMENYNCSVFIPATNYLEDWNIYNMPNADKYYIQQPIVDKLNKNSISKEDLLLTLFPLKDVIPAIEDVIPAKAGISPEEDVIPAKAGISPFAREISDYYSYVRIIAALDDEQWVTALQKGYYTVEEKTEKIQNNKTFPRKNMSFLRQQVSAEQRSSSLQIKNVIPAKAGISQKEDVIPAQAGISSPNISHLRRQESQQSGNYLITVPSLYHYAGLERDNPFLQELPSPITKQSWGISALISRAAAEKYKLSDGDIVKIKTSREIIEVSVIQAPGTSDEVFVLEGIGSGLLHPKLEIYGIEKTGNKADLLFNDQVKHIRVKNPPGTYSIMQRQSMKRKKERSVSGGDYFRKTFEYLESKWELTIEQKNCTGCNACVISCQIENNIPVIGKAHAKTSGLMHWLKINTYIYENNGDIYGELEPLMCQQCENAPCETVCPVGAASHNTQGLNTMTYNRCIGARFCMVNCPYGVRTFNYDDYSKNIKPPLEFILNPDVTVRSRGVAEKCTFCIQRINEYERNKTLGIENERLQTACQQACPTNAIRLENIIGRKRETSSDDYKILEHLNTLPSVTYKSKFRNCD